MKQIKCFTMAAVLLTTMFPVTGCGGFSKEPEGATLEIDLSKSYRSEQILEEERELTLLTAIGDRLIYQQYDDSEKRTHLYCYDTAAQTLSEIEAPFIRDRERERAVSVVTVEAHGDGGFAVLYNKHSTSMNSSADTDVEHTVEYYDRDLQLVETVAVTEGFGQSNALWETRVCVDGDGNWYVYSYEFPDQGQNPKLEAYNSEFQKYGEISLPSGSSFHTLVSGADGNAYALVQMGDHGEWLQPMKLSAADKSYEDAGSALKGSGIGYAVRGTGDYAFYYDDAYAIYGWNQGESTEIVSWLNSDFDSVMSFYPLSAGRFVADNFTDDHRHEVWVLERRTQEEIDNTRCISLAVYYLPSSLKQAVMDYNRSAEGSRILIKDYSTYNNEENNYTGGMEQFRQDMLDGIVADIICADQLRFDSLANKGMFLDWYDLMDADKEFHKEDYLTNFFEAYETKGRLQRLGVAFSVSTVAAKAEHVGTQQGMDLAQIMALQDSAPDGMQLYGMWNHEYMLQNYFYSSMNYFVDGSKNTCSFDTPEFAEFLRFLQETPLTEGAFMRGIQDDSILLYETSFGQPIDYHAIRSVVFKDAEMALPGYPTHEGNGGVFRTEYTLSVNSESKYADIAWDFVKHLLSEDYQSKQTNQMPILKKSLEEDLDLATKQNYNPVWIETGEVNVSAAPEEEMTAFYDYIRNIRSSYYYDETVYNILWEEVQMLLAGDSTPEETAKMIQSRAGIYLSEQS